MSDTAISQWTSSLSSADRNRRAEAAIKLGQHSVAKALPALRMMVDDDDPVVALSAMYACWKLGEDRISIDRIIKALSSDDEEQIQQAVHTACALGSSIVPKLEPLLDATKKRASLALQLLEEIGGPEAMLAIRKMENTDNDVVDLAREILEDWDELPDEEQQ